MSRTNVVLDDKLIQNCQKLTGIKTIKDVIHYALQELARHQSQKKLLKLKGKINWDEDLNHLRKGRINASSG